MQLTKSRSKAAADDDTGTLRPKAEEAIEKVAEAVEAAATAVTDNVGPAIEDSKDKIGPVLKDAKAAIVPVATAAVVEGRRRGRRAAEKLGVVEEEKKSHKLRNLLIVLGLGALIALAYKKFTGKDADDAWTSRADEESDVAYFPDTGVAGGVAAGPVDGSDTAPTAPLASEETVESPMPTTPDEPLQRKDLA